MKSRIDKLEKMGVNPDYVQGWAGGFLGNPEREEQRVTDAYSAGYEDGQNQTTDSAAASVRLTSRCRTCGSRRSTSPRLCQYLVISAELPLLLPLLFCNVSFKFYQAPAPRFAPASSRILDFQRFLALSDGG